MRIFLSYSSKDEKAVVRACELLEKNGSECFIAPRDISLGKEYAEEIINGIDKSDAMILFLSANANKSPHVLREVERAVSKSIPILVCKMEEVEISKSMEYFLMAHQWVNVEQDKDFTKLLQYVKQVEGKEREALEEKKEVPGEYMNHIRKQRKYLFPIMIIVLMLMMMGVGVYLGVSFAEERAWSTVENRDGNTELTVEVGDTLILGRYNGAPISWRVLRYREDGTAVLISKDILTMKAFDVAESGTYNWDGSKDYWGEEMNTVTDMELQTVIHGNSDWSRSNIRMWLNSDEEVVVYSDQSPMATAMAEKKNGYHNEAGFLHDFTEEELAAIQSTEIITKSNGLLEVENVITMDRVYLLSLEELQWFSDAGMSQLSAPTQQAVEQDQSNWYVIDKDTYGVDTYCWWLREPVQGMADKCYLVGNGYREENILEEAVGLEGYGIRPAITVDLTADCFKEQSE